jgi:hypothetical protein
MAGTGPAMTQVIELDGYRHAGHPRVAIGTSFFSELVEFVLHPAAGGRLGACSASGKGERPVKREGEGTSGGSPRSVYPEIIALKLADQG